jgi:hypothetical protein
MPTVTEITQGSSYTLRCRYDSILVGTLVIAMHPHPDMPTLWRVRVVSTNPAANNCPLWVYPSCLEIVTPMPETTTSERYTGDGRGVGRGSERRGG